MAYTIPPDAVLEVTFEGTQDGQQIMSVFHFILITGAPIPDGAATALAAMSAIQSAGALRDKYADCIPDVIVDFHTYAQWITPDRFRYIPSPGADWAGTVAQSPYPVNVAVAITKFSEDANRHGIGTLHMPAVPLSFVNDSETSIAGRLAYTALADILNTVIALGGGVNLHPVLFNRANPSASSPIDGAFPQDTSRVMRRRTVRVGS